MSARILKTKSVKSPKVKVAKEKPSTNLPAKKDSSALLIRDKNKILTQSIQQLRTSRNFKRARMKVIAENEDLAHGIIPPSIRNPFNECFPYMAGYIDHLRAKIDDDSTLSFKHTAESDLKRATKIQAFYDKVSSSIEPNDSWDIKHRHAKYNTLFSGRAIYKFYCERSPKFKSNLDVISHYDFHNEPRGGAILENHLFCGQDNIFKNQEDIRDNELYDQAQVVKLLSNNLLNDYKLNNDPEATRNNRYSAMGEDPVSNNYVGQQTVKLAEWYTTYGGQRYYVLFNELSNTWIRMCALKDIFPDEMWPYLSWATNEDPDLFWSKAPADDARPTAKILNTMINQELYNRQKRNYGQRIYDPDNFPNVASLADWRPDGLVPFDSKNGQRAIASAFLELKPGDLNGTENLMTWVEDFVGKQIGYTNSSVGQTGDSKKVAVFQGEIQQVDELINVKNKSYRNFLSLLGLHFKQGVEQNLDTPQAIQMLGANGIEWSTISKEDLAFEEDLKIQPIGGTSEIQLKQIKDNGKFQVLQALAAEPNSGVNPAWLSREMLILKGYDEAAIKDAFSQDSFATRELLSEAAEAEKEIVEGKSPKINRGANSSFMQHIVDFATDTENLPLETFKKLMAYAKAHTEIAVKNESNNIKDIIRKRRMSIMSGDIKGTNPSANGQPQVSAPAQPMRRPAPTLSPTAGGGAPAVPVGQ